MGREGAYASSAYQASGQSFKTKLRSESMAIEECECRLLNQGLIATLSTTKVDFVLYARGTQGGLNILSASIFGCYCRNCSLARSPHRLKRHKGTGRWLRW